MQRSLDSTSMTAGEVMVAYTDSPELVYSRVTGNEMFTAFESRHFPCLAAWKPLARLFVRWL